ncbi:MAG TPA: hypothetical protein VHU18_12925 [Rhizomicrobium sp.]|jgi:hypothetical protein|nr:hypothetical protein [Rhizomicrobium sp.]
MTIPAAIAHTTFIGERPNGDRFEITLQIGQPYQYGPEEWACPIALAGLYEKLSDIHGGDAIQALCLAIRFALNLLSYFKEDGGRVLYSSGEDVLLEVYGFESLRQQPAP